MVLMRKNATMAATATSILLLSAVPTSAQQCEATLAVTSTGMTRLEGKHPRLFVTGNFHTNRSLGAAAVERKQLRDLAYVTTRRIEGRDRHALHVLLSIGNGCFNAPERPASGLPDLVVGDEPALIAVADLDGDGHEDIAVVDAHVDEFSHAAKLRIFVGDGAGHFKAGGGVSVVALTAGQRPVAMALGRFRGHDKPMDIAIVSTPPNDVAVPRGQLTLLVNNGAGEFRAAEPPVPLGDFRPTAMVASDQFRKIGKYDLVIKEAADSFSPRKRILFLQNSGDGRFPDIADITASAGNEGAGKADALLTGVVQSDDTAGDKLDIVTFDEDMTLRLFVNEGFGTFNKRPPVRLAANLAFAAGAQFFPVDFGNTVLSLITVASSKPGNKQGMVLFQNDGSGGFSAPRFEPFRDLPIMSAAPASTNFEPSSSPSSIAPPGGQKSLAISTGVLGQFLNPRSGNQRPDVALVAHHVLTETKNGPCPATGPQPLAALRPPQVAGGEFSLPGGHGPTCINTSLICPDGLKQCENPPVFNRCFCRCADGGSTDRPPPPPPTACRVLTEFPPMLVVIGNPFTNN